MAVRPEVLFVVFQTAHHANGGIRSISEIVHRLQRVRPILLTQVESATTQSWRAAGHEVHVWPLPGPVTDEARSTSRRRRLLANLGPLALANFQIARFLRERRIRVVHCNDGWASLVAGLAARMVGSRVVLNIRDTLFGEVERWKVMRSLSDRVIVLSEEMRDEVDSRLEPSGWMRGLKRTPMSAIYSIVDMRVMRPGSDDQRRQLRLELGISQDEIAVGVIGALVPKKQQLELLRNLNEHPERLPASARIYFVGDFEPEKDPYSHECEQLRNSGPLRDRIRFVGYTSNVASWYRALDLTLMVSRFEGLPRAMIESVACGTPVLAFDFCSAREILEQHGCGVVVQQGDYPKLLAALQTLSDDSQRRRALAAKGPEVASQLFAPERVVSRYEDVYLDLGA